MLLTGITASVAPTSIGIINSAQNNSGVALIVRHPGTGPGATVRIYDSVTGAMLISQHVSPQQIESPSPRVFGVNPASSLSYEVMVEGGLRLPSPGLTIGLHADRDSADLTASALGLAADGASITSAVPLVDTRTSLTSLVGTETINVVKADGTPGKATVNLVAGVQVTDTLANILAQSPAVGTKAYSSDTGAALQYTASGWEGHLGIFASPGTTLEAVPKTNIAPGCNANVIDVGIKTLPSSKSAWQLQPAGTVITSTGYTTKALMDADVASIADKAVVRVGQDSTVANNGWWQKISGAMVKTLDTDVTITNRLKQDFACGKNKFDATAPGILVGKYLADSNGSVQTSANYTTTGYMHVVAGTTYTAVSRYCWVWYDGSLGIISISPSTDSNKTQTAPTGAYFARISWYTPTQPASTFQLEVGTASTAWEPYHGFPEVYTRLNAIENLETFGSLGISLTDAAQLARAGGTLQGGAIGSSPQISLPINWQLPGIFEVDFQFPADPNVTATAYEIMSLALNGSSTPLFKLSFTPTDPTVGYYVQTSSITATAIASGSPISQTFVPPQGPDAFSVRKVTPTSSDVTIICETLTDRVKIYNGGTTIGEWLFSSYATLTLLTAQMQTDLGSDYVVKNYNVAGFVPSDLARNIVYLCKSIPTVDPTTGIATGGTTYDSFESFLPTKGLNIWHKLRVEINLYASNPTFTQVNVFLDDLKILNLNNGTYLKTVGGYNYYLNYSPTGGTGASMPVRNFKYTNTFVPVPRAAVVMIHVMQDSDELPATGDAEVMSSARLQRVISSAYKYGWTFVSFDYFLDMVIGKKPRIDKVLVPTYDDSSFNWDDKPGCKAILIENIIKNCTAIMTATFDFTANAAMLQRVLMNGNQICGHGDYHFDLTKLSYSQFVSAMNAQKSKILAAGYDINCMIAPGGFTAPGSGKWMLNNGWTMDIGIHQGANAGVLNTYAQDRKNFRRVRFDDCIAYNYVDALLNV